MRAQLRLLLSSSVRGTGSGVLIGIVFALAFGLSLEVLPTLRGQTLPGTLEFLPYLLALSVAGGAALGAVIGLLCGLATGMVAILGEGRPRTTVAGSALVAAAVGALVGSALGAPSVAFTALLTLACAGAAGLIGLRLGRRAVLA